MSTGRHLRPNEKHDYEFLREYSRPPLDASTRRLDTSRPPNLTLRLCHRRASFVKVRGRGSPERDATNQLAKALREASSDERVLSLRVNIDRSICVARVGNETDDESEKDECQKCATNNEFCRFTSYCTVGDLTRGTRSSETRASPARRRHSRFTFGFTRIQRL